MKLKKFVLLILVIFFTACQNKVPTTAPFSTGTPLPPPQITPEVVPTVEPAQSGPHLVRLPLIYNNASINPASQTIQLSPDLPSDLADMITLPPGYVITHTIDQIGPRLEVGARRIVGHWTYALVAPFPSLINSVSTADLTATWKGHASGPFIGLPLLMDENTLNVFSAWWGSPGAGVVQVLPRSDLLAEAWQKHFAWALIPFEDIGPRWKVVEVDGQSPLRKDFDSQAYSLNVPLSVGGEPVQVNQFMATLGSSGAADQEIFINRDAAKLTTLVMTGVTALVRATANLMEKNGITYPDQDIRSILRDADLTHISNEVAFSEDCPAPNPNQEDLVFCSRDSYIGLLEDVGTDIVELSGDHFSDWSTQAVIHTLDLYKTRGWQYFGGGANLTEGRQALLIENNGNRLAFIGCNAKGPTFARARDTIPGAAVCDLDWMEKEITRLRGEGYLPIATFQHREYYTYNAQADQIADFGRMARAGAVIVSGSQAHQPQAMAFDNSLGVDAFIHYGLGNLFFDQYYVSEACRQAFIDRHIFYNGRYLGVELLPIIFVDLARSRPMTVEESDHLLQTIFTASGW